MCQNFRSDDFINKVFILLIEMLLINYYIILYQILFVYYIHFTRTNTNTFLFPKHVLYAKTYFDGVVTEFKIEVFVGVDYR